MNVNKKGFTLVELLIVIGILAILATTAVIILNPAQLLAQSRDGQRLSDLASIQSAIALYLTDVSNPSLGACTTGTDTVGRYHVGAAGTVTSGKGSFGGVGGGTTDTGDRTTGTAGTPSTSTGWVDVPFVDISGGSPISNLPVDPTNDWDSGTHGFVYRYACDGTAQTFELNAELESLKYEDFMENINDGGNDADLYEIGTEPGLDL